MQEQIHNVAHKIQGLWSYLPKEVHSSLLQQLVQLIDTAYYEEESNFDTILDGINKELASYIERLEQDAENERSRLFPEIEETSFEGPSDVELAEQYDDEPDYNPGHDDGADGYGEHVNYPSP